MWVHMAEMDLTKERNACMKKVNYIYRMNIPLPFVVDYHNMVLAGAYEQPFN